MKPQERLRTFEPEVQELCNIINGFDINKKYKVSGLEAKLKGIDILAIQNLWIKHMKQNCSNISYINMNPTTKYTPCLVFNRLEK